MLIVDVAKKLKFNGRHVGDLDRIGLCHKTEDSMQCALIELAYQCMRPLNQMLPQSTPPYGSLGVA
jgi:hypothetical protein